MTYEANVPTSTDSLGSSQSKILTNFQQIAIVNAINHVAFNDAGKGKHKFLQMPEQASAPTTAVNEGGFYAKVGVNPAETNLFFRGENSNYEYQLTKAISASTGIFSNNTLYDTNLNGGWTFLPGGMILQYGKRSSPSSSGTVTFPIPFPSANPPFSVTSTILANAGNFVFSIKTAPAISSTGFTYDISGGTSGFYWMAIGV